MHVRICSCLLSACICPVLDIRQDLYYIPSNVRTCGGHGYIITDPSNLRIFARATCKSHFFVSSSRVKSITAFRTINQCSFTNRWFFSSRERVRITIHDTYTVAYVSRSRRTLVIQRAWPNEREVADKSPETRLENPRAVHVRVKNVTRWSERKEKEETSEVSKFETGKGVPEKGSNSVYDLMYQSEVRRKKKEKGTCDTSVRTWDIPDEL